MSDENSEKREPTTEEILASIRRIIAEDKEGKPEARTDDISDPYQTPGDGEGTAAEEIPSSQADANGDDDAEDILELTERVDDPEDSGDLATAGQRSEEPAVPEETPVESVSESAEQGESLLSEATAGAVTGSFAELARALGREPEAVRDLALGEGNTLEDVVKEQIRPMLKEWVDDNLPALVEQLVRKEIQRMARRAGDE